MRRRSFLAVLAAVAIVLASCTSGTHPTPPKSSTSPAAPSAQVSPVAWHGCQDVARQVLQKVPANINFDCATVTVPQDWESPSNGKTFDLALMRVRSIRQSNRIGSLLVNPGGPGGSGVELAVYLSQQLPTEILDRFDVVGFDPRGVSRSSPVKCFTDADLDAMFGADPDPVSNADFNAIVALNRKMADECQAKYGDALRLFSTVQTAHDLDAIRAAVGDPKINYLGYSYGTLLGATYAQLFPRNIRSFVLDGAVDPTENAISAAEGQAAGFEHAFDQFATWCAQNAISCPIAPDARGTLNIAMTGARSDPVQYTDGRKATAGWLLTAVIEALYSQSEWPALAQGIASLIRGNAKIIFQLADAYANRSSDGHYGNMFDIFNTVSCNDDRSGETIDQARGLQSQWRARYPLFGATLAVGLVSCAVWPTKRDPYPTGKATGAPPIVVVGTTNDPATPYEQTAKLANMLGVGTVLTWQGEGHTAYPQTTCIRNAVDGYLIKLTVPAAGTTCPAK